MATVIGTTAGWACAPRWSTRCSTRPHSPWHEVTSSTPWKVEAHQPQQTQCRSLETQDDGDTLRGGLSHPSTHRPTEVEGGAGPCPAAADGQQPLAEKPGEARENRNGSSACSGVHSGFYLGVSHPLPQDLLSRTTSQWLVVGSDKEELIGRVTARRRSQEAQTTDCQQLVSKRTARLTTRQQGAGRNIASELVLCCGMRGPVLSRVDGPIRSHGRGH